jgi:amino acid transporter
VWLAILFIGALVFSLIDRHDFSPMCGVSLFNKITADNVTQDLCDCVHVYRGWLIIYSYVNVVPLAWIFCILYRVRKRFSSRRDAKQSKRRMVVTVAPVILILGCIGMALFIKSQILFSCCGELIKRTNLIRFIQWISVPFIFLESLILSIELGLHIHKQTKKNAIKKKNKE